jgi:hypothetical protein
LDKTHLCLSQISNPKDPLKDIYTYRDPYTKQDLKNLQPLRAKTIINTYAVSAPGISIEEYNPKMDLGVVEP